MENDEYIEQLEQENAELRNDLMITLEKLVQYQEDEIERLRNDNGGFGFPRFVQ